MNPRNLAPIAALAITCSAAPASASLIIEFDYSYDTSNFFTPDKRRALNQVAAIFEQNLVNGRVPLTDQAMGMGNFSALYTSPQDAPQPMAETGQSLGANVVRIYVAAADLTVLGVASLGGLTPSANGSFSGWGGSMVFDTGSSYDYLTPYYSFFGKTNPYVGFQEALWYVDDDIRTTEILDPFIFEPEGLGAKLTFNPIDFASIAMHEMGHIFGLPHSGNPQDAMYPLYPGGRSLFDPNDWRAMEARYWYVRSETPEIPAPEPLPVEVPTPGGLLLVLAGLAALGLSRAKGLARS